MGGNPLGPGVRPFVRGGCGPVTRMPGLHQQWWCAVPDNLGPLTITAND